MAAIIAAMMFDAGCDIQAPLSPKNFGSISINGISSNICRLMESNIDIQALPKLWK